MERFGKTFFRQAGYEYCKSKLGMTHDEIGIRDCQSIVILYGHDCKPYGIKDTHWLENMGRMSLGHPCLNATYSNW